MNLLLLVYAFFTRPSDVVGSWQKKDQLLETLCFDEFGNLRVRGTFNYDGTFEAEDTKLIFHLSINDVIVTTVLQVEQLSTQTMILADQNGKQQTYQRLTQECAAPLAKPNWQQMRAGNLRVWLPENWSFEPDDADESGFQRTLVQSPDGLSTVLFLRLPYDMIPNPGEFDYFVKGLFREFLLAANPEESFIEQDMEGLLFGRTGTVFSSHFRLAEQPVYAQAICPKAALAYNLVIFTLAAHNESAALRRVVFEAELVP
ncbi:MAG: hypothetical protein KDC35_19380 [Acidobacteria bacterium]|nr:hypothetical protein [Acidobacteriota bacterium]